MRRKFIITVDNEVYIKVNEKNKKQKAKYIQFYTCNSTSECELKVKKMPIRILQNILKM